ncbi:MAG: hypothetical protein A2787_01760 [Omnitrophica WOR_2 bacterium RIFCSPHIGHO2_01_FULL_48_9]|nr:MAG: hypothetical protein A2787_01760 [Omnitrophica WOR_2 bacterium RIFCSPHIGHO2_01_FULL_48_9]
MLRYAVLQKKGRGKLLFPTAFLLDTYVSVPHHFDYIIGRRSNVVNHYYEKMHAEILREF